MFSENNIDRLSHYNTYYAKGFIILHIYKLYKNIKYIKIYNEEDKIISYCCRNTPMIDFIESEFNCKLSFLRKLTSYILDENGGMEFIHPSE